jgi:hypothetical protein
MQLTRLVGLLGALAIPASAGTVAAAEQGGIVPCPADVLVAVRHACPCDGSFPSQRRYLRCARDFRRLLERSGCLTADTRRLLTRCARRSSCGPPHGVRCCRYDFGVCGDAHPGDGVAEGSCSNIPGRRCDVDRACTTAEARMRRSKAACAAWHGIPASQGSVCDPCPDPMVP